MRRFGYLAILVMLGSSAHAASFSFVYHGHRVHVERPRHCFSTSCLSVTVPGLLGPHHDPVDDAAIASGTAAKPAPPSPALQLQSPAPPLPAPSPALVSPAPTQPAELAADKPPAEQPAVAKSQIAVPAASETAASATASQQSATEPDDTALGDWQTEANKGLVRIEPCGSALCGYMIDAATNAKGETILINMKTKSAAEWAGTIVSRAGGNTYYAKMAMKQPSTLRVEACAVGRFFCSGNDWSRIVTKPQALITSRQSAARPPS
jgi:uncharacterized protein (DUF2147 family)